MLHYGYSADGSAVSADGSDMGSGSGSGSGTSSGATSYPVYGSADGSGGTSGGTGSGSGVSEPTKSPISMFLASQGTFCADNGMGGCASYMGPAGNYLGWFDGARTMSAAVDYAGLASNWLMQNGRSIGTSINGSVIEEPMPDGRRRVTVDLHGDNVSAFVTSGTDLRNAPVFGYRTGELTRASNAPAIGHVQLRASFIIPAGAPIPDLMQLIVAPQPGQKLESFVMIFDGHGIDRRTGLQEQVHIAYDGSMGPIYPSHPSATSKTTAMGQAQISISNSQPKAVD